MRNALRLAVLLAFATAGLVSGPVARADAPPGATARCNDGTFSFSQTHSGTCSHHGGVAAWLAPGASTPTAPAPTPPLVGTISVGSTVRLVAPTRGRGCTLGALPDRRCSPGAYYDGLTTTVLCAGSFHTSAIRNVPESEKHAVEIAYGLLPRPYGSTLEIDHIVSLELGGSNDI